MDVKAIYNLTLFLLLIFVPFSNSSLWGEMLHPKLGVKITSKIPGGVVRVKCISSESDIKEGYLESSSAKPFIFEVELKFLTTVVKKLDNFWGLGVVLIAKKVVHGKFFQLTP
ncbi:hypothetical protein Lal_00030497 [Lupinus albus]|nr:hypothetical protein Lal_00030497 [Lupinus albus]